MTDFHADFGHSSSLSFSLPLEPSRSQGFHGSGFSPSGFRVKASILNASSLFFKSQEFHPSVSFALPQTASSREERYVTRARRIASIDFTSSAIAIEIIHDLRGIIHSAWALP
jgi:hypothetical protein